MRLITILRGASPSFGCHCHGITDRNESHIDKMSGALAEIVDEKTSK